jgi:C-terminal processing protease CtpA/Prc
LGISIQNLTNALKEALNYDRDVGVLVNDVEEDSPAQRAGIQEGDIIIEYNGEKIVNTRSLTRNVRASQPGDEVDILVVRKGRERHLMATIGETSKKKETDKKEIDVEKYSEKSLPAVKIGKEYGWLGVLLQDVTEQLGEYFGVTDGQGALITEVVEESPAEKAGLKAGDVIVGYARNKIDGVRELVEAIRETEIGAEVEIRLLRERRSLTLHAEIGQGPEKYLKSSFPSLGIPTPEHDDDIQSYEDLLKQYWKHFDTEERERDLPPRIRVYGETDKEEMRKLKERIEKLEREIEKIKEKL